MPLRSPLTKRAGPDEKIALFRSLFQARRDVYAVRFESRKTGRSGYQPACGNEWVKGVCEKPRIKCSACRYQQWLPVTDEAVRWHLEGVQPDGRPFVMGAYPMLLDETCHWLAIDLDGDGWWPDALAFREVCERLDLGWNLERSRSGNGGHLWFFFEQAVPAADARKLGAHLLTEALDLRPEAGLSSYDRFFPNQDTLPQGGFGNLIALPLQQAARRNGHTMFVDADGEPYADQWHYLSRIERIPEHRLEPIISNAAVQNRIMSVRMAPVEDWEYAPWTAPPSRKVQPNLSDGNLPSSLDVVMADQLYIQRAALSAPLRNQLLQLAAFQNPEFYRAQAMRLPVYNKPRVIACGEIYPDHLALPRGCLADVQSLAKAAGIRLKLEDLRQCGEPIDVTFQGELRPEQQAAACAMLNHETGVLSATTAFGKTVTAAWMIAERRVNTLVLVHRRQLLEQWVERLSQFLGMEVKAVGMLGGGRRKLKGQVDVALIQSCLRKGEVIDEVARYGQIIVDECHHLPAVNFEKVVRRAKARYVHGLSATVQRKDGHHPIIFMQCGPVRHRVDAKEQARERPFNHRVIVRPTGYHGNGEEEEDRRFQFQRLCQGMVGDRNRNQLICSDAGEAVKEGRHPLVLTERTEHLDFLAVELNRMGLASIILKGGLTNRERKLAMAEMADISKKGKVLLATGSFIGEGFDCPKLDTLLLAMPVSWRGTLAQYAGRLHRLHAGKREVRILDYADLAEPMLNRMFERRCRGYEALGYRVEEPASANSGWPASVSLPSEAEWKNRHGASLRRLMRDGLDETLAELYAQMTFPDVTLRSDAEAFLYRRLQSLPETAGKFEPNGILNIPFGKSHEMEVDFLWRSGKVAVELDGEQHLHDAVAWRRDRAKDRLLQQHGYLILRFLAVDLGENLDEVLDSIRSSVMPGALPGSE